MLGDMLIIMSELGLTQHQSVDLTKKKSKGKRRPKSAYTIRKWLFNAYAKCFKRRAISVKNNGLR